MNVERMMSRDVRSCSPSQTLAEAARLMWERDCGCIPVVDADGQAVGMVTDRDICMAAYFKGRTLHEIPISDSMSRQVLSCHPDDTVEAAESIMKGAQIRRLPVIDASGRLVGVLSLNDIAREAAREHEERSREIELNGVALTLSAVSQQRASLGVGPNGVNDSRP